MTESHLQEIINEISDNGTRIMRPHMVMKAMKQAVNEAIEECVDRADVKQNPAFNYVWEVEVDIDKLLNLKVK